MLKTKIDDLIDECVKRLNESEKARHEKILSNEAYIDPDKEWNLFVISSLYKIRHNLMPYQRELNATEELKFALRKFLE